MIFYVYYSDIDEPVVMVTLKTTAFNYMYYKLWFWVLLDRASNPDPQHRKSTLSLMIFATVYI